MKKTISSSIEIHGIEMDVNLGWAETERARKQSVLVDIFIKFVNPPKACLTDELSDTYCYNDLVNSIKTHLDKREFRLLEHLGHELYQLVKKTLSNTDLVSIRTTKKPPIANVSGASFFYGDFEEK